MKKRKWFRGLLAMVLAVAILTPSVLAAPASGRKLELTDVENSALTGAAVVDPAADIAAPTENLYHDNEIVRILVTMSRASALEAGYPAQDILDNAQAVRYMDELREVHLDVAEAIVSEVSDTFEMGDSFTLIADAFEASVRYGDIDEIDEYLRETYGSDYAGLYIVPEYEIIPDEDVAIPNTMSATEMVGATNAWTNGYTGAGTLVAVIDTGLDLDHPSFDADAFNYSILERQAENDKVYDLVTKDEIAAIIPKLHAFEDYKARTKNDATVDDIYRNAKVPFAYNYVDDDFNTGHDLDEQGDHGTHVSGIVAANRYVKTTDENGAHQFERQENGVIGVAPDAQLVVMKVFGVGGGAYASDYMVAIEDAIALGCDSVNLSLGSTIPGRSYDTSTYQQIFEDMVNSGTVVVFSAGNNGYWPQNNVANGLGLDYAEDVNMQTGGSSGSYANSFTVASDTNTTLTGFGGTFNGYFAIVTDGSNAENKPWKDLDDTADASGREYDYVFLGDPADEEDTDKFGAAEAYTDEVKAAVNGKIVLVSRGGGVNFADKHVQAENAGAVGVIVYNNVSGTISMTLQGSTATIPCASIQQRDGEAILENSTLDEDTGMYTGKMSVKKAVSSVPNDEGYTMSDFSSWGTTGNLAIKPEITAPGGNIFSTLNGGQYGVMSGTSMSAPSVTGQSALVAQYINENGLLEKTKFDTKRALAISLLMSTATPLIDPACGQPYSVRQQGAGLSNVDAAIASPAYIVMDPTATDSWADGKIKAELGDDAQKTGVYTISFELNNLTDEIVNYVLDAAAMTPAIITEGGEKFMSLHSAALAPQVTFTVDGKAAHKVLDLNGDGVLDVLDAEIINEYVAGLATLTDTEIALADLDSDGKVTSKDVYSILAGIASGDARLSTAEVNLPANGSVKITATVTLSAEDKALFAANNPNGAYVEGFIKLDGEVPMSVPFLAFYGNFTDPSMYDRTTYLESTQGISTKRSYVSANNQVNFITMRVSGSTSQYYFGFNLYAEDSAFDYDRNMSFSSASGNTLYSVYPTLIRPADRVHVSIYNEETKEVYWETTTTATAAYYNSSSTAWASTASSIRLGGTSGWTGTDAGGKPLEDGTKVKIKVVAAPELYVQEKVVTDGEGNTSTVKVIDEENLGRGAVWENTLTIDNTAPVVESAAYNHDLWNNTDSITVTVTDNRHVAAVELLNATGRRQLISVPVDETEPGATSTVALDITNINGTQFILAVVDYAGNIVARQIDIGSGSGRDPGTVPDDPEDNSVYALVTGADETTRTWNKVNMETASLEKQKDLQQAIKLDWQCAAYYAEMIYGVATVNDTSLAGANGNTYVWWMDYDSHEIDSSSGVGWTNMNFTDITYSPTLDMMVMPMTYGTNPASGLTYVGLWSPGNTSMSYFNLSTSTAFSGNNIAAMTYLYTMDMANAGTSVTADFFLAAMSDGSCYLFMIYDPGNGQYSLNFAEMGKMDNDLTCTGDSLFHSTLIETAVDGKTYYILGTSIYELTPQTDEEGNITSVRTTLKGTVQNAKYASAMLQLKAMTLLATGESGGDGFTVPASFDSMETFTVADQVEGVGFQLK